MKKIYNYLLFHKRRLYQIVIRMKLVCIAVLISLFQLQASVNAQDAKIDVQLKDVKLDKVFSVIHEKTGYNFMFNHEDVSVFKVDAKFKNSTVRQILTELLEDLPLGYKFDDNLVLVYHKEKVAKPKKILVKGKVTDDKGNPLPGVSVIIKGTTVGVSTNNKGEFSIEFSKVDKNSALVFSFIGMKSQEIKVKGKKEVQVKLIEDKKELEEVVITGYANINKESFTGNAVSVKKDEIIKASPQNVLQALQLFDPSLRLTESNILGSNPNALPEFYIRGRSGIGISELDKISEGNLKENPNRPTFILDGFEVGVEKIYDLDVNRIKSLTILKDAAATAIYGSRAANGVIVIEREQPKMGEVRVSYNGTLSVTTPDLEDYNLFDARGKLEAERLSGLFDADTQWQQEKRDKEYYYIYNEIAKGINTDWLAVPTRNVINHNHSVYIEGGHEDLLFGIDLKSNNKNGVMKGSFRDSKSLGFSLTYRKKSLLFRNYMSYEMTESEESKFGDFSLFTSINPYISYKDMDGEFPKEIGYRNTIDNPMNNYNSRSYDRREYKTFTNDFSVQWFITEALRLKGSVRISETRTDSNRFDDPEADGDSPSHDSQMKAGQKSVNLSSDRVVDINSLLIYNKRLKSHNINLSCGINIKEDNNSYTSFSLKGFPNGLMDDINFANDYIAKPNGMVSKSRLFGSFLTSNYSFKDIYLFDVSCRLDGSSKFGTKKKYATFWAGGVGLNLHKYSMFSNSKWINYFKVRASYGETGKTKFSPNAAKTMYTYNTEKWYLTGLGSTMSALGNDNLKWEKTITTDLGFDLQLLDHLFDIRASYYIKRTQDLVSAITVPASLGFPTYMGNTGELENKGYEVFLNSNLINRRDLKFNVYANLTHNKNKMTKISKELKDYNDKVTEYYEKENKYGCFNVPLLRYTEGTSLTAIYAMKSLGINPANGKEVFEKKNGDLTYTWDGNENVICGDKEPDFSGAFGFNLSYKKFSIYTAFTYEIGGQAYNQTLVNKVEQADIEYNVDRRVTTLRWQNPGDLTGLKNIRDWGTTTLPTSRFVQDNDFMCLKSLTVSYELPEKISNKMSLRNLKLQLNTDNLFRLSSIKQERGLSYPFAKTYNLTLKAKF